MAHKILYTVFTSRTIHKLTASKSKEVLHVSYYVLPSGIARLENGFMNYSTAAIVEKHSAGTPINQAKPTSEIPGPMTLPVLGNTLALMMRKDFNKNRISVFVKNIFNEYGPIIKLKFPGQRPIVIISRPEDIETVYRATNKNPIRESPVSLKQVRNENINNYFQKKAGLLPEDNEEWWRVRSRVQTPMMKPKNIVRYLPQMDDVALEFMDSHVGPGQATLKVMESIDFFISSHVINDRIKMLLSFLIGQTIADFQRKSNEMPEHFLKEVYKWSLESIGLVALNRRLGCLQPNLPSDSMQMKLINNANEMFASLDKTELSLRLWRWFPTKSYKELTRAHNTFLKIADATIRETEAALKAKGKIEIEDELTLMESLLLTEGLSRKDVVTLILDMLFAGIDTVSHTLAFTLYLLAKHPVVQEKLQKEVDEVLGDGKGSLNISQLSKLSYLKACVKESLRILPVSAFVTRIIEEDIVLGGYVVPKGYQVFCVNMMSGWDENNFESVDEFLPERWSRDRPLGTIHPYASLPFSHGPRMCIGRRIAEQEIYTFLARMFHRYNVEYHYADMGVTACVILRPTQPLKLKFTERIKH